MVPAPWALQRALMTRKNTSTGATAFNAPTNSEPRSVMMSVQGCTFGMSSAKTMPTARPTRMRLMRLISLYFLNTAGTAKVILLCLRAPLTRRVTAARPKRNTGGKWCGRKDLNLHGGCPPEPKSGASANSATPALLRLPTKQLAGLVNNSKETQNARSQFS